MLVTPLQPFKIALVDGSFRPFGSDVAWRTGQMHQGEVIHAMMEVAGENVGSIEGEDPELRAQMGFLWERVAHLVWTGVPYREALEAAWREYVGTLPVGPPDRGPVVTQVPLEMNGLRRTPDGLDYLYCRLESYKFTWKSMRTWIEDPRERFWPWLAAEQGYLAALNADPQWGMLGEWLTVRFFIFWAGGDYSRKPGHGPQATFTDVSFTRDELAENEANLGRYRAYVLKKRSQRATTQGQSTETQMPFMSSGASR